jgi:hypothetical protein
MIDAKIQTTVAAVCNPIIWCGRVTAALATMAVPITEADPFVSGLLAGVGDGAVAAHAACLVGGGPGRGAGRHSRTERRLTGYRYRADLTPASRAAVAFRPG